MRVSGRSVTVSPCMGNNPGCVFSGWNTKADGSGMTVTPGQEIQFYCNLTLYAQWECKNEEHSGGGATCRKKAICVVCGESYGELAEHSFTIRNPKTSYRKSAASCTSKAVYYYSCVCGKKGTETFEYGGVLSHTDEDGNHRCDFCGGSSACVCRQESRV